MQLTIPFITGIKPFSITFKEIGFFGKPHPRVLWIGMEPALVIQEIQTKITSKLLDIGFSFDKKDFSPHLTIARIKKLVEYHQLTDIISKYKNKDFQTTEISEIILFESILKPSGPEYRKVSLHSFDK